MDLFAVPTASLRLLYGFFVIEHGRRHILHFNATHNPTSAWVIQQLREAFPYDTAPRYLVFDRDAIFSPAVVEFIRHGHKACSHFLSQPLANGTAERWIGNCRREMLEHVVVLSERHLVRLNALVHQLLPRGPLPLGSRQRHPRTQDPSRPDHHRQQKSSRCREWVGSTTATNGATPPEPV